MNNLYKYLNQWANRLVIRILMLSGTPKEQIDRVLNAMEQRNTALDAADNKIKARFKWTKYLIITLLIIAIVYITLKIKKFKR